MIIQEWLEQVRVADQSALLQLLAAPLAHCFGILPAHLKRYNTLPLGFELVLDRHVPQLQHILLERDLDSQIPLIDQYFCPEKSEDPLSARIALHAYSSLLSFRITVFSVARLARLSELYSVDKLYDAVFQPDIATSKRKILWEQCVKDIAAVPAKIANALEGSDRIPASLEHISYFRNLSKKLEITVFKVSRTQYSEQSFPEISHLLHKLINIGLFPFHRSPVLTEASFFAATLSSVQRRLSDNFSRNNYATVWACTVSGLPAAAFRSFLISLLSCLNPPSPPLDRGDFARSRVAAEARLLCGIIGKPKSNNNELWSVIDAVVLGRVWNEGIARIIVGWVAGADPLSIDALALEAMLSRVLDVWVAPDHVKHSSLSKHQYLTSLLLLTISYLPPSSESVQALPVLTPFINSVGLYIGHMDQSVRLCGILVAEIVADKAGKKLDFGVWNGAGGAQWFEQLRALLDARDIDAVGENDSDPVVQEEEEREGRLGPSSTRATVAAYDSDDSLTGYASPASSRSVSPTPSELADIEKDPTLRVGGQKRPARPVYLPDLGALLQGSMKAGDPGAADKLEVALSCAEELIRKKKGFGFELDENAVNLTYWLIGLQDNYELPDFESRQQAALNALVACCPKKAALTIIEQFFTNQYSTSQRFVMLNSLALGARELAALPVPPSTVGEERVSFPSRRLLPRRHKKYSGDGSQQLQALSSGIVQSAIKGGRRAAENARQEPVRERQLRVQPRTVHSISDVMSSTGKVETSFKDVAAEYFVIPLINSFWLHLREDQTRESRAFHSTGYRGSGTGLILDPVTLAQFLRTLAILMHAAHNSPAYLAVLAPEALEVAIALGTRLSRGPSESTDHESNNQVFILVTALELAVIVLDACLEIDSGRSLGLERAALVIGLREWAEAALTAIEKGLRLSGGGGDVEVRLRRAAAGILVKINMLTSQWGRSMIMS